VAAVRPAWWRGGPWIGAKLLGAAVLAGLLVLLAVVLARDPAGRPPLLVSAVPTPGLAPLLDRTSTLTQTVGGYTFILRPVWGDTETGQIHADPLQIVLDYAVRDPQGQPLPPVAHRWLRWPQPDLPDLVDSSGVTLPWLGAASHSATNPAAGAPIYDSAFAFDASPLRGAQPVRTLHFTVSVPLGNSAEGAAAAPVIGPFTFNFRLPFDPWWSTATVQQTVTAHAVPITLERVVMTRAEARVILRFASPDGGAVTRWQARADLGPSSAPAGAAPVLPLGVQWNDDSTIYGWQADGTWVGSLVSATDLLQHAGPWTLTVHDLQVTSGFRLLDVAGPWVFHFTIPPAAHLSAAGATR
jgi:hypothetical protein